MTYMESYQLWSTDEFFDKDTKKELAGLNDEKEIEDRFYCNLKFGTGGLRGVMGAGTNRMNKYTVGKATTGLGKYLLDTYGLAACKTRGIAIGYDTRNNSSFFADVAADVLSGMGISVFLHSSARPTPQLSFSVKTLNCLAGVVITASHNPKEYNGYKVYDENGCQLVPHLARQIIAYVDEVKDFREIRFAGNKRLINKIDVTDEFVHAVLKQSRNKDTAAKSELKIVYTPLHGTGRIPVLEVLEKAGFDKITTVKIQADEDGDFPTVASPNPEDKQSLKIGIGQAEKVGADIVLGTDPDSDRVGVAVKTYKGYQLMTGNQIGALVTEYLLEHTELSEYTNPALIKTIVTSELGAEIARKKGVHIFSTLTGFKFIGEKITQFEKAKVAGAAEQNYTFLFGYEESYGYLAGTHARDKDAVVSSLLICEMAAEYKKEGKTLLEQMEHIYTKFGYYHDALDSFTLKGKAGLEKITAMMKVLRSSSSPYINTAKIVDYSIPVEAEEGFGMLPMSDVLKYILEDGSWVAVRPSGTEPKIKIYYSSKADSKEKAERKLEILQKTIRSKLELD